MKKIEDYLHYYLGGQLLVHSFGEDIICEIINISISGGSFVSGKTKDGKAFNSYGSHAGAKLLLRPLPDMTEDEGREYGLYYGVKSHDASVKLPVKITDDNGRVKIIIGDEEFHCACLFPMGPHGQKPESLRYLIKQGFDMFELIPAGLAIDKTKITKTQNI